MIILLALTPTLVRASGIRSRRNSLLLGGAIQAIALTNAAFLALGLRWSGLGLELVQALWFAAPLALWAFFSWPRSPATSTDPVTRSTQWVLIGFPLIFFVAALARIDFFHETGYRAPTAVAWLLTYFPTLAGVSLAIAAWLAVRRQRSSPAANAMEISAVLGAGLAIAIITSLRPTVAFILSATVTFGSGY
ncbi:MAG: hypothetical protein V3W28_02255, partial [Thermoplasmata archaeon]